MIAAFALALGQLGDPRFGRVLARGVGLAALLLAASAALVLGLARWLLPETVAVPGWGEVAWLDEAGWWVLVPVLLALSALLMVPVASAMTSLFLDEVAEAVEARHYPGLPPARPQPWPEALRESLGAFGAALGANVLALAAYLVLAPLAPLIFVALNGWLLGRESFMVAALRRQGREEARALRARHAAAVWALGALVALPLLVPVVNLAVPTLGAAAFTHLHRRLVKSP